MCIERIKELVTKLNFYCNEYYNKNNSIISDKEYDELFDELKLLEEKTGFVMSNSPTINVGYEVKSELKKVKHNHKMLSLDKTKNVSDLIKFLNNNKGIMMLKMDGLTVSLRYLNGQLVSAETRGDSEIGEDILHNAKVFRNIPLKIDYKEELIVDGEAIITYNTFDKINSKLPEDKKYRNPRNLVSGSVRQLDNKIAKDRNIEFVAWKVVKGFYGNDFHDKLICLYDLGFEIVPCIEIQSRKEYDFEDAIEELKEEARILNYPIDGIVAGFNDIAYSESLGETSHHLRSQIAYKFYDEEVKTVLKDIEWTIGKTGVLTPTAVFKPIEIDGTIVEKASLHNISIMEELYPREWYSGLTLTVYKANQIIPQVSKVEHIYDCCAKRLSIPSRCPVCGGETKVQQENNSKILMCTNPNCRGKLLGKLTHFVSRNAMNIDGLSEATLEKLINFGWIKSFVDIYQLKDKYGYNLAKFDGFGKKSVDKLYDSIEASKNTTLDRFINALSIPLIGKSTSKTIAKYFNYDFDKFIYEWRFGYFDWTQLKDFGLNMYNSMEEYISKNYKMIEELAEHINFEKPHKSQVVSNSNVLKDKVFVITGSLNKFKNREEAKNAIENAGGKVTGSVTSKTDFLVNNDIDSKSGKNKKAKELNIPIINEEALILMLK